MNSGINPVEILDMDYDIQHGVNVNGEEAELVLKGNGQANAFSPESFEAVARYIALMPEEWRPEIIYHTANPEGETKLRQIMELEAREGVEA